MGLVTTTEIANEIFDAISKLRIAPEGLESLSLMGVLGLETALNETACENFVTICRNLKSI